MKLLTSPKRESIIISDLDSNTDDKTEFFNIINDIISNETVQKMKNYRQHCNTSCYTHCLHVAYYSYIIAKKLNLDYCSTARAAMLHDLFLYDWRKNYRDVELPGLHAFVHPEIALKNSLENFSLNKKEIDIILKHMWPVTFKIPKYKESFIVSFVDKCFAVEESFIKVEECEKEKVIK